MKAMEYGKDIIREVLYHGVIDGVECAIINTRGSHPCAYINVPKSILDKYDNPELDCDKWYADCHGGFTYANIKCHGIDGDEKGFWLGWDYAHCDDYTCTVVDGKVVFPPRDYEKIWTPAEVLENVIDTIHSLEYYTD